MIGCELHGLRSARELSRHRVALKDINTSMQRIVRVSSTTRKLSQGRRRWCVVDVGGEGDVEGLARKVAIPTLVLRALPNPAGSPIITPPTTPEHHVCTSSEHAGSTRGPGITPCISHQPRRTWCRCPRLFLQMALGRWYYHSFRTSPSILTAPVKARQHREQLQYPPCSSSDVVGSMYSI